MEFLTSNKSKKGILFAGCSFTWGQGLYYYSGLPSLIEPEPDQFDNLLVNQAHYDFMTSVRFSRQVANYYNTFDTVIRTNGGSIQSSIEWIFGDPNSTDRKINLSDYEILVLQLTNYNRNRFKFKVEGEIYTIENIPWLLKLPFNHAVKRKFNNFLDHNKLNIEQWCDLKKEETISYVKDKLTHLETVYNMKTFILNWDNNIICNILNDNYLTDRLVHILYKNRSYYTYNDAMNDNPELTIHSDFENFKIPPQDHHPSLTMHNAVAQSIIEKINKS